MRHSPRFQLRLSTLLILMVVTAALMFLNTLVRHDSDIEMYGWLWACALRYERSGSRLEGHIDWMHRNMIANAAVWAALLGAIAFISERWSQNRRAEL